MSLKLLLLCCFIVKLPFLYRPCPYEITSQCFGPSPSSVEYAVFKEQAELDWDNFLLLRAAELVPGNFIVTHNSNTTVRLSLPSLCLVD